MVERGAVYNRAYAAQLRDFTGLNYGKITPTDIDAVIDFGGKACVIIEMKHKGARLPYGQALAIERIIDGLQRGGVDSIALIAEHDSKGDIDFALGTVVKYRWLGEWLEMKHNWTVRHAVDGFLIMRGLERYLAKPFSEAS